MVSFEVLVTAGDFHIVDEDLNNLLVNHFVEEFKKNNNKDIFNNSLSLIRLKISCELDKRILSFALNASFEADNLYDGIDFYTNISRDKLEELYSNIY